MKIVAHKIGRFSSKKTGNGEAKKLLNPENFRNRDSGSQTLVQSVPKILDTFQVLISAELRMVTG